MPTPVKFFFSLNKDNNIQPDPTPTSKTFKFLLFLVIFKTSSIIISVSGLGIKTSLVISKVSFQKLFF